MASFVEIADRLAEKKEQYGSYKNEKYEESWKPEECKKYVLPPFTPPVCSTAKGAEAKWRTKLSKMYAFVKSVQHKRLKGKCTVMPISTLSKINLDIWGTPTSVVNARNEMCSMGLISPETQTKRFGKKGKSECYTYRYYEQNESKFIELCKTKGIEPFAIKNDEYDEVVSVEDLQGIDKSTVRFTTHLRLVKPEGVSDGQFEKALTKCLYENYPAFRFYQKLADWINEVCYKKYPELRIRFKPNFNWSDSGKSITSIGIRATNSLVSISKKDRPELLNKYGLVYEKDIKSSVPRLTRSMALGAWFNGDEDFYEAIFRLCEPDAPFTKRDREAVKKLYMRAYFEESPKQIGYHTWNEIEQTGILESDVRSKMAELRKATEEVSGGKTYGNEIFYIESCVYLGALALLVMQQYDVWLLYDCFYCRDHKEKEGDKQQKEQDFLRAADIAVGLGFDLFYNYVEGQDYDVGDMLARSESIRNNKGNI